MPLGYSWPVAVETRETGVYGLDVLNFRSKLQIHSCPHLQNCLLMCDFHQVVTVGLSEAVFSLPQVRPAPNPRPGGFPVSFSFSFFLKVLLYFIFGCVGSFLLRAGFL